jgi:hypothetical protein
MYYSIFNIGHIDSHAARQPQLRYPISGPGIQYNY